MSTGSLILLVIRSISARSPSTPSLKASRSSLVLERILSAPSRLLGRSRISSKPRRIDSRMSSLSTGAVTGAAAGTMVPANDSRIRSNSSFKVAMTSELSIVISGISLGPPSEMSRMASRISSLSLSSPPPLRIKVEPIVCRRCSNSFSIASSNWVLSTGPWLLEAFAALAIDASRST